MNRGLLRYIIRKRLEKLGVELGVIDVDSLLDETLSPRENWERVRNQVALPGGAKWPEWQAEERARHEAGGDPYRARRDHPLMSPEAKEQLAIGLQYLGALA